MTFENRQNDEYWTFHNHKCAIQQCLTFDRQIISPPLEIRRPIRASGCRRLPPPSVIDSCRLLPRRRLPNETFAYKSHSPLRHCRQSLQAFHTSLINLSRRRYASMYQVRTPEHTRVLPNTDRFYFRLTEYWNKTGLTSYSEASIGKKIR